MKRPLTLLRLMTVISLCLGVIWHGPAFASGAPALVSLGQIKAEGMRVPGAMDLDGAGNLYVADVRGGLVHKFSPYGQRLASFDLQATGRGLAVNPAGTRIYVARKQSVVIADATSGSVVGTLTGSVTSGTEFGGVSEIDLDAAGNVFVVDSRKMLVKIYSAAGQYLSGFGGTGTANGKFTQIGGMAINTSGKVVVADTSIENNKVHVFTLGANLAVTSTVVYTKTSTANFGSPLMYDPRGLAFDDLGRGYFLEFISSQIRVTSATFGYLGSYTATGYGVGQLNSVMDVVYDAVNKRLFVSCDTARIEILGVDGGQNPLLINRAPTTPVPQSPIGSSTVESVNPTLVFANASDADGDALTYQVVVKRNDDIVYQTTVPAAAGASTGVTVPGAVLQENAAYVWTVQAFDAVSASPVSAAAGFVVNAVNEPPAAPSLLSPANNASIAGADTLTWTATVDPDPNDYVSGYRVEIARDAAFAEVVVQQTVTSTSLALGALQDYSQLENGAAYFWRVVALDQSLTPSLGGAARAFTYNTTQLTVTANVPGSQVYLGGNHAFSGRLLGVAPLDLRDISPGATSLVVKRAGVETYVSALTIAAGVNTSHAVTSHAALLSPAMEMGDIKESRKGINGNSDLTVGGKAAPFLVDFNNNGKLDMLVGDAAGQVWLFADMQVVNRNRVNFEQGVALSLPVMPGAVPFVADWNNDGRKDLLVGLGDGTVRLFLNQGQEEAPVFGEGLELSAVSAKIDVGFDAAPVVIDYDKDGRKDLMVGNAAGQVLIFYNRGTDAQPQLNDPVTLFAVTGAVVPMPVDWDADGQLEIMTTNSGSSAVYALQLDGSYLPVALIAGVSSGSFSAFPLDIDGGKGKEIIVGGQDGLLHLLTGANEAYAASFTQVMQDKLDELGELVADVAPAKLVDVTALAALIGAGDYASAALAADTLALSLPAGAAQASAYELAVLCL